MSDGDLLLELQRIALGQVPGTKPTDRISAIKTFLAHRKIYPGDPVIVNVLMINGEIVTNDDGTHREFPVDPETGTDGRREYLQQLGYDDAALDETVDEALP
jgi:hypothetical protein